MPKCCSAKPREIVRSGHARTSSGKNPVENRVSLTLSVFSTCDSARSVVGGFFQGSEPWIALTARSLLFSRVSRRDDKKPGNDDDATITSNLIPRTLSYRQNSRRSSTKEPPHRRQMVRPRVVPSYRQGASGLPRTTPPLALSYTARPAHRIKWAGSPKPSRSGLMTWVAMGEVACLGE